MQVTTIPYRTIDVHYKSPATAVREQLAQVLNGGKWRGHVSEDTFLLQRRLGVLHAPGLPVAVGRITPDVDGTRVRVTIRLAVAVFLFGGLWMVAASLGALACLIAAVRQASVTPLVAWTLPIAGWAILTLPFDDEARKLEATLRNVS